MSDETQQTPSVSPPTPPVATPSPIAPTNAPVSQAGIPQTQEIDNTATGAPAENKGFLARLLKLFNGGR